MKKIIAILLCLLLIGSSIGFSQAIPDPTQVFFVNDYANVLTSDTEQKILDTAASLYSQTKAQVVVVTIDSLGTDSIENYAYKLFQDWGIGDSQKNNGVLILVSIGDSKSRIEVGYGLEGALNDAKTGRIQDDYMLPHFREGSYDEGILQGFLKIVEDIYIEYDLSPPETAIAYTQAYGNDDSNEGIHPIFIIILLAVIFLDIVLNRGRLTRMIFYIIATNRGGSGRRNGGSGGGFSGGGGRSGGGGSSRGW